jgi:hypothetical protein
MPANLDVEARTVRDILRFLQPFTDDCPVTPIKITYDIDLNGGKLLIEMLPNPQDQGARPDATDTEKSP